jgi:hypothetical protein
MKIFISWSGDQSRMVAELLADWIKCVLQATQPWLSTRDIDHGALWFSEVSHQLNDTSAGIVCLTQENKERPWILFEAGALAKGLSANRVCTFLIDLLPADIRDPLAQFNHTLPERSSVWSLIRTLNSSLGNVSLEERTLTQVFGTYWPQFEAGFREALQKNPHSPPAEPRGTHDLLAEILENTRFLQQRVASLENRGDRSREPGASIHSAVSSQLLSLASARVMAEKLVRQGYPEGAVAQKLREAGCSEDLISTAVFGGSMAALIQKPPSQ